MSHTLYMQPVKVTLPSGKRGVRYTQAKNARIVDGQVVADARIDGRELLIVLDEETGFYYPCDKALNPIPFQMRTIPKIRLER